VPANDLLLLSTSTMHGSTYLAHAREAMHSFLAGRTRVVFAPYALFDHDTYTARVATGLAPFGVQVTGLHSVTDPVATLAEAEVFFVGGGNSFRLVHALHRLGLIEPVREAVQAGKLGYMGSSAGTNMACPTMRTTNDMPIVQPVRFSSFGLIPFQINPHYIDPDPASTHMGETREERILQFHEENDVPVLGLREGAWLRRIGDDLHLEGTTGARLFRRGQVPEEIASDTDISWLLTTQPRFDTPI